MRMNFTLCFIVLFSSVVAKAQNITGIWKGYFVQKTFGMYEDKYRFEVQIAQMPNNALKSVTYSYKTRTFYGKADAIGIYTKQTNNILINELKMLELKIDSLNQACLMTCYLEYNRLDKMETLTGTFSSRNADNNSDCGTGTVYLEKSPISDFKKEDFVTQRENELARSNNRKSLPKQQPLAKSAPPAKKIIKPGAEDNLIAKNDKNDQPFTVKPKKENPALPLAPQIKKMPTPEVIAKRQNELVKTITTDAHEFTIDLYDNGEIDNDRITVYHNNQLIVSNKALTDKPISFTIEANEQTPEHEFVMVAENLGSIPPNTALMVITAGDKRYELFVTSTEQKNAVVKILYRH